MIKSPGFLLDNPISKRDIRSYNQISILNHFHDFVICFISACVNQKIGNMLRGAD